MTSEGSIDFSAQLEELWRGLEINNTNSFKEWLNKEGDDPVVLYNKIKQELFICMKTLKNIALNLKNDLVELEASNTERIIGPTLHREKYNCKKRLVDRESLVKLQAQVKAAFENAASRQKKAQQNVLSYKEKSKEEKQSRKMNPRKRKELKRNAVVNHRQFNKLILSPLRENQKEAEEELVGIRKLIEILESAHRKKFLSEDELFKLNEMKDFAKIIEDCMKRMTKQNSTNFGKEDQPTMEETTVLPQQENVKEEQRDQKSPCDRPISLLKEMQTARRKKSMDQIGQQSYIFSDDDFSNIERVEELLFKAHSLLFGLCAVAVKSLSFGSDLQELQSIKDIQFLHHPNIVSFFGVLTNIDNLFLGVVTEYMEGGNLNEAINSSFETTKETEWREKSISWASQIAKALAYSHYREIIHGNVTPQNVRLNKDMSIAKLCNFELSGKKGTTRESCTGTFVFMSPDLLAAGDTTYQTCDDVWSFAIFFYTILHRRLPFQETSFYEVASKINRENFRPELSDQLPNVVRDIIQKCWRKTPEERPTMYEVVELLEEN